MREGEEELFVFDAEDLVRFDEEDGPKVAVPLPPPRFHGRLVTRSAGHGEGEGDVTQESDNSPASGHSPYGLSAGSYLFMQWRPSDEAGLLHGIEWFARESWWEGNPGAGPYVIRRLVEDGKTATQILRKF